ncbi:hypothetical protein AB0M54_34475 [Actinoplanes sp. NPDC051470]|uniref:hypothetical protein n=1 Tax=Actinoplanes sp. NPDC051470 TaxID=3157224 RepID=UPI00343C9A8E
MELITTADQAAALAGRLTLPGRRTRPVVVLTIAGGQEEPFGSPDEIESQVGDLADVVLMPTSDVSWAFTGAMPPQTQVYGGAGRVYPVDHAWVARPSLSRLRFAYSMADRKRITEHLINDALAAALAAGLLTPQARPGLSERSAKVIGLIGSRALVKLDDGMPASVWEELTLPGVGLDRVLVEKQVVRGVYDPAAKRLDVRGSLPAEAPVDYAVGDVVLADVAGVSEEAVRLRLVPGRVVEAERAAVTSNPNDTLCELFTIGEVVVCRVVGVEPYALRLDDIDDDEEPVRAPALLDGGPPWLRPPPPAPLALPPIEPPPDPAPPAVALAPVAPAPRRPSPLDIAPWNRPPRSEAASAPGALDRERARVTELTNELAAERSTRSALAIDLAGLRARAAELEAQLGRETQAREAWQTRYRNADRLRQIAVKNAKSSHIRPEPAPGGEDAEVAFRCEVVQEWARRIPAAERDDKALAAYTLGPDFLASLDRIEGVSRAKVVAVVVEVLAGQAPHLAGREPHQLREGGAGSPYRRRDDGATCWRVALQRDTPAARRMHYWRLGERYELSRVVLHDDYRP